MRVSRISMPPLAAVALSTLVLLAGVAGCEKGPAGAAAKPPVEVTVVTIAPRDVPLAFDFVAQTQSSREVEIRARVEGFLEKRVYTEGELVQANQPLFLMDRKPFEATLKSAQGQLAQQKAALKVAEETLKRVRPLAEQNALSQKDLDDAVGNVDRSRAAVFAAEGQVQTAELNLGYATILSPLRGLTSFARVQEGAFLSAANNFLTTVSQIDPIWVNFSISENEALRRREQQEKGLLRMPKEDSLEVEAILADGTVFPHKGRISFADPSFSKETGTFLVRAELANPKGVLRPGQFVKVRVKGAVRPGGIVVPQRAVQQGAKSNFVWVVAKDDKAEQRAIEVGSWIGDDWFVNQGLREGERVVVDGALRTSQGAALKVSPYVAGKEKAAAPPASEAKPPAGDAKPAAKK